MVKMSYDALLHELNEYSNQSNDISEILEKSDDLLNSVSLNEAEYNRVTERFNLEILDVEKFIKINNCKCVSNPRAFTSNGVPSADGLLSNTIFGYTTQERTGTFAYIDLHGWFLTPSYYKTWSKLDSRIKNIVFGVKYYSIDPKGELYEDEENGETGIDFLRKNMSKIKFKYTSAESKQLSIKYLEKNRDNAWINKYIVIPPYYRDKNTSSGSRVVVGLDGVNKLYNNLIIAANALLATQEYGYDATDSNKGRVQDIVLQIYDYFCGNTNKTLEASIGKGGRGLSGKMGIMRTSNLSKTADYSSRLVISANDLKVDKPSDLMVTFDKSAVPLYAVITQFKDFIMYQARLFFENEFTGSPVYPVVTKKGVKKSVVPDSPEINFSDERIKKEMDRFLHGYNNRFVPIEVPVEGTNEVYYMTYKGHYANIGDNDEKELNRRLTWCDVFFIAAVEATRDKQILITRFPIDSFSNQFTTGIEVASTKETEEIVFNNVLYKWYPKIREEDIGTDTSNSFVDTLRFSNTYLAGIGGDYDGDQVTCKGVYTREANEELRTFMNNKQNFITFGCKPLREPGSDSLQSIYALTKVLSTTKITKSEAIQYK